MKSYLYKNEEWLRKKYCEEKLRVIEIAEICEVSRFVVYEWIKKFCLIRDRLFPKRSNTRYSLNERYFENIDNEKKAYWLGFIAADGCLVNEKGKRKFFIELSEKDRDHLEKFKKEIKYEGPIYDLKRKGRKNKSCKIQISSCRMVQDLIKHGIVQNKSMILKSPDINPVLYSHWIRGYFDGDGSISISGGYLSGDFFSGSRDVVAFVANNIPGTNTISKKKDCNGYYHSFRGNGTAQKIYNYLYKNSSIYLARKKEKFLLKVKE